MHHMLCAHKTWRIVNFLIDLCFLSDSFLLTYYTINGPSVVPLLRKGLTWYTDKNIKYRNPKADNQTLAEVFEGKTPPPHSDELWSRRLSLHLQVQRSPRSGRSPSTGWTLSTRATTASSTRTSSFGWGRRLSPTLRSSTGFYTGPTSPTPTGFQRETTAPPFPTVSFQPLETNALLQPRAGLNPWPRPADFPVQYFRGRKELVLTTVSWFGGQNHFLPIAYLVTSSLILLTAVVLTGVWWKFGKDGKNMAEWGETRKRVGKIFLKTIFWG